MRPLHPLLRVLPRLSPLTHCSNHLRHHLPSRLSSTNPPKPSPTPTTPAPPTPAPSTRTTRLLARLPPRLRPYAQHFSASPVSYLTTFLILHELTAIIPAGAIFGALHYTQWTPPGLPGEWVQEAVDFWGGYTRRKGWEVFKGEEGARLVLELATAWALVKVAMPVRLAGSAWMTPGCVRGWERVVRWGRGRVGRK